MRWSSRSTWPRRPPPIRRARVLNRFLALMNQHKDTIAAMITAERTHSGWRLKARAASGSATGASRSSSILT